jgi:biopolymer transport protein ExbD
MRDRIDLPEAMRIEKTVFIKAPRSIPYGEVVRVLDGIRGAGASPVGLQIDDLN